MSRPLSARTRLQRRQLAWVFLFTGVLTPIFNVTTVRATVRQGLQGLLDAALITFLVGGYLLFVRDGSLRHWFRRRRFATDLVLSSSIVLVLFLIGRAVGQVLTTLQPQRFVASFGDDHLVYALPFFVVLALMVQFVLQVNSMIGPSVLRSFVAGTYHRPRREERIFLFLDLEGSTTLAERLGSARYFDLLQRFVDDLTEPILATEGAIYQYAGDEVVITWPLATGVRAAGCVRCFFAIQDAIAREAGRYMEDFGVVPSFRGGLHGGTVTAGQLGDLRREIVFVGDILNTAARLEEYAKHRGLSLVVSGALLERLVLPAEVESRPCGELTLRGKEAAVTAYELGRRSRDAVLER